MCWDGGSAPRVGRKRTTWVSSSKRGENSGAGKIGRRGVEKKGGRLGAERRRAPEESGLLPQGGSCCCSTAATLEKLGEDLFAAFNSSWRENKPHWSPASDQETTCLIPTERNSRGLSMTQGVGKRNGDVSCWWGKSMQKICGFRNTLYPPKFAVSIVWIVSLSANSFL